MCQSWLVLSGGLGSSIYLRERLRTHYTTGPGSVRPAVDYMAVATVEEPYVRVGVILADHVADRSSRQLAVIQGLVSDRIQSIERGIGTFTTRCCRQSYGVLCQEEYKPDSVKHVGQPVKKDSRDGKMWVDGQIQWFIQQVGVSEPFTFHMRLIHCPGPIRLCKWSFQAVFGPDRSGQRVPTLEDTHRHVVLAQGAAAHQHPTRRG